MYQNYCEENNLPFETISSVTPYDDTTLFCPAGMQKFKRQFVDTSISGMTVCNIQSCIRLNDLDSLGDGTHLGCFDMIGTFSFRHWSIQQTLDFWMKFLERIEIPVDYVTVHPDRPEWKKLHSVPVREDSTCEWSDGTIGGYCTEFYSKDVEIGNIVNPLGTCIDVGFGLERIESILNGNSPKTKEQSLIDVIQKIVDSGYTPSHYKQGYVLKRLLRTLCKIGGKMDHPLFRHEVERQNKMQERYRKLLSKNPNMSDDWWYTTHGIVVKDVQ
jgi:alanyl-tRNA synthetase